MLQQSSIMQAMNLAEQFDAAGVYLTPVSGTPLDYLYQATGAKPSMIKPYSDNGDLIVDFMELEQAANTPEGIFTDSRHDAAINSIKKAAVTAVQKTLAISRNIVAPEVKELVELVNMRMEGAAASELTSVSINPVAGDAVMYNGALITMLSKHELQPVVPVSLSVKMPDISLAEILGLLETGNTGLDGDIAAWAADQTYRIQSVYREFFVVNMDQFGDVGSNVTIKRASDFESQVAYWKGAALAVFLISRHLLAEDKLFEGTDMSLESYRKSLTTYMEQAGRLLCRQVDANTVATKNGVLVKSIDGNQINVNAPVYNTWMENDGDNDVLLGMAISKEKNYTLGQINAKAAEYREAWRRHMAMVTQRDSLVKFNFTRTQIVLCYESMLAKPNADGGVMPTQQQELTMKQFRAELDKVGMRDLEDLYHLCLTLICKVRYDDTHAFRFLSKMAEISQANPSLNPREAGTAATIWYITSWVAEQTQVNAF